jgi:protein ImuB
MGLKRVGQLYGRDRKALQARFGASLITRLDQALGYLEERVTPRIPIAERYAERRYAEPIGLIDDVLMTTRDLAIQLSLRLEAEGLGAQSFHLFLYRVDHKVMSLSVNAARATRDAGHIARLFANRAERLVGEYDAGFGIDMIRLAASSVSEVNAAQIGAFETRDGAEDLDRLYDRMTSRLGPLAVVRSKFVNTHIPERAVKLEPVVARTPDDPEAKPDPTLPRPLRLLPAPEPIAVTLAEVPDGPPPGMIWRRVSYRFVKVSGPERIGVEWWTLAQPVPSTGDGGWSLEPGEETDLTRDYFIAEDEAGRRFWLFREGLYRQGISPRWFLHGFFA